MPRNVAAVNSSSNHPSALQSSRHLSRGNGRQFDHGKHSSNETMRESEEGETIVGSNPGTMKKGHTRRSSSITAFLSIFAFAGRRRRTDSNVSEKAAPVLPVTIPPPPTSPTSSADSPSLPRGPSTSPTKKNPLRSVSVPAESRSASEVERRPPRRFPYLHPLLSRRRGDSMETVTASDNNISKGKAHPLLRDGGNPKEPRNGGAGFIASHVTHPILARPAPQQKIVSNLDMHVDQNSFPPASSNDEKAALDRFYAKQERLAGVKRSSSFTKPLPSIPIPAPTSSHAFSGLRSSYARSSTHLDAQGSLLPSSAATFGMPSTTSLALTTPDEESRSSMGIYSIGDPRRSAGMPDDEFINVTPSVDVHELESTAAPMGGVATSFASSYASISGLPSNFLNVGLHPSSAYGASTKPPSSYSHSQPSRTRKPSTASVSEKVKHQPSLGSMATAAGIGSSVPGQPHSRMKKLSTVSLTGDQKSLPAPLTASNIVQSSQHHPPRRSAKSLSKPSMSAFGITDAAVPQERSRSPISRQTSLHPTPGVIPKSKSYAEFKSRSHLPSTSTVEPPLPPTRSKTAKGKNKAGSKPQDVPSHLQSQPLPHRQSSRQLQQPIRRLPSISSVVPPPESTLPTQPYHAQYPLSYQPAPPVNSNQLSSQPLRRSHTVPEPSISPVQAFVELAPPPPQPKASGRTSRSSSIPNSAASGAPWSGPAPPTLPLSASTQPYFTTAAGRYVVPPIPPEPAPRNRPVSKRSLPALPSAHSQVGWGR